MEKRVFVGRDEPLRALRGALAGAPCVVLVSGEAGIGKTRLLEELASTAVDWLVLHGECVEFGGEDLAFAPVVAALRELPADALEDHLDTLSPEARGALAAVLPREAPHGGAPGRLYELLLDLLAALDRPVLLVLEDIHWADRSTLALLAFLARNLRSERIAVVATYRVDDELPAELRRLAQELRRRRTVHAIELAPLGEADVARQLEAIAGAPVPAALASALHERAGGNPFFVEELYAARANTLAEAVRTRVAHLDERVLATLAAAGGRASYALLDAVDTSPDALRAGVDAGVLVRERDGVAFRHGLIGEVLYERLLPAERAALHRALAAHLTDPAQRAHHCQRAGLREEALAASIEAGTEAARVFAYAEAGLHLERAIELGGATVELLALAAQAARFDGHPELAVERCRQAIELTDDPVCQARLYERLGEYHFWDDKAALRCYEHGLELAPGDPCLLAAKGHALMGLRRWTEARACCEAALDAGAAPHITLAVVLTFLGDPEAGEAHARRALELSQNGEETARAYIHLGEVLRVRGDHAGALQAMVDGEREASRLGLRGSFGHFMFVNAADDLLRLGRWDEAAERVAVAARMELSRTASALRRAIAGALHAARGEFDRARIELDAAADDELPAEFLSPLAGARAALALAEGDPGAAGVHIAGALGGVEDPFYTAPLYALGLRAEAELAERERARRREPDGTRAATLLSHLDALAGPPDSLAYRALAQGELARVDGTPAPDAWATAAAAFDALGEPYPAAYARLHEAEALLAGTGRRAAATEALRRAGTTAAALAAAPLADAVEALARRARITLAGRAAGTQPADDNGAGLTAREVEVLQLLTEGLTNRQIASRLFVSQKTVGAHMAHIYDKLGVHSRVEAAGRARALGLE